MREVVLRCLNVCRAVGKIVALSPRGRGNMYNYIERSSTILARLFGLNFTPEIRMRIGAVIGAYKLFETGLKRVLWALKELNAKGQRPCTENLSANAKNAMLGGPHSLESGMQRGVQDDC